MKVGYFFWGHLGDKLSAVTQDSPDGNAWYSSSILGELLKTNNEVWCLAPNRDSHDFDSFGSKLFGSFEGARRVNIFEKLKFAKWEITSEKVNMNTCPDLDIILLEWRFPIPGRNTESDLSNNNFQPDYLMQKFILNHYGKRKCKIVLFDLDYKITPEDEQRLSQLCNDVKIFETSNKIKVGPVKRRSVEIPFWMQDSCLPLTRTPSEYKKLVYIGSRYERDDVINDMLVPFSNENPFSVWFFGNWTKYPDKYDELYTKLKWRNIQYHGRVGHSDFRKIYGDAIACPLIAKREYFERGFVTARIQECLYFGTIPIGFDCHYNINRYLPKELIASSSPNTSASSLNTIVKYLQSQTLEQRHDLRSDIWRNLCFMDVKYFVEELLK